MDKIEERYNKLKEELSRLEDKESNLALLLTDFMHEMEDEHPNLIEPNFKVKDWVVIDGEVLHIKEVTEDGYLTDEGGLIPFRNEKEAHIWSIADAEDGDVLAYPDGSITLFKYLDENLYMAHVLWVDGHIELNNSCVVYNVHPASKEQRDLLFQKMRESGYEWDFENKKLEKELPKGEDYGIDGLYHAIRILEKTLGKVDGYQTDDGILEHQCAISAVKELGKKKPIKWSKEDEDNK